MKKLLLLFSCLVGMTFTVTSCLDNDGNKSNVTMNYVGRCVDVQFTDENDEPLHDVVVSALGTLGLEGESSMFSEHVELDYNSQSAANALCDQQAWQTYRTKVSLADNEAVTAALFQAFSEDKEWTGLIPSPADMPVHDFTASLCLLSPLQIFPLDTFYVSFKK